MKRGGRILIAVLLASLAENQVRGQEATASGARANPTSRGTAVPQTGAEEAEALREARQTCDLLACSEGMPFPVMLLVDGKESLFYGADGSGTARVSTANAGPHVFQVCRVRGPLLLCPSAIYEQHRYGEVVWRSERTQSPCRIELQAGDSVTVFLQRPSEPFDARFLRVRDVDMALTLKEISWYRGLLEWERKEKAGNYPNTLFFLVAPEWGPEKVFADLARAVVAGIHDRPNRLGFHAGRCLVGCQLALTPEGKIPPALLAAPRDVLERELTAAFLKAFREMKETKCYPELSADAVRSLKRQGLLSAQCKDGPRNVTLQDGLRMAEVLRRNWVNGHYRRTSARPVGDPDAWRTFEDFPEPDGATLLGD